MKNHIENAGISPVVRHFDDMPGNALVDVKVVAAVRGMSIPTVWRHVRKGLLPQPQKNGGCTRWLVRDLRTAA